MKPGRNDPYPCGSGKKYKHCYLIAETQGAESGDELTWRHLRRAADGFPRVMSRFVADVYGADAIHGAWEEFTVWAEDEFDPASPHLPVFLPWFYHHWGSRPARGDMYRGHVSAWPCSHQRVPGAARPTPRSTALPLPAGVSRGAVQLS